MEISIERNSKGQIKEKIFKNAFETYLKLHKATEVYQNRDGVDIVANIKGIKKYFELKTSSNDLVSKGTYFGAMSQVEWECALAHPNDFYLVLIWYNDNTKQFSFKLFLYTQLLEFADLEPYATYLNMTLSKGNGSYINLTLEETLKLPSKDNRLCVKRSINPSKLLALSKFYYGQRIQSKLEACQKFNTPVLIIIPSLQIESGYLKKKQKVTIVSFKYNRLIKQNMTEQDEATYFAVIAIKASDISNDGTLTKNIKLTKNIIWARYYKF